MDATDKQIEAGQAAYTKRTLAIYDLLVLGLSNRLIWKCSTARIARHYDTHISANHLDVGVGTGYFLDRCRFPAASPRVALMDLNVTALEYTAKRIERYRPELYRRNVLEPIPFDGVPFDSIGLNYLLHCLPGTMASKASLFDHLLPLLKPGGVVFGSTLLHEGIERSRTARGLMAVYNRKGIFSNQADDLAGLERELQRRFTEVTVTVIGCVALFFGTTVKLKATATTH